MIRHRRVLCETLPAHGWTELSEEESHHVGKVLRLADGEEVEVLDGRGSSVFARIRRRGKSFGVEEPRPGRTDPLPLRRVTAEIAVLKSDAMEWLIEKLTEIGVQRVTPVWTDYGVIKAKSKPEDVFRARWQSIADQALKQSGRLHRLWIDRPTPLSDLEPIADRWILDPRGARPIKEAPLTGEPRFALGPEGGFTDDELRFLLGGKPLESAISLGNHILRAETAGICTASFMILS